MPDNQLDLLAWEPRGETATESDKKRLGRQMQAVFDLMRDGQHRTLAQMAAALGEPPASVSARWRDLKNQFGFDTHKQHVGSGVWVYWMVLR
jgi:hypothetical protein